MFFGLIIRPLGGVSYKEYHRADDVDKRAAILCEPESYKCCLTEDGFLVVWSFLLIPLGLMDDYIHVSGSS